MATGALVILTVIPPGTTSKTGGDQADWTADLTSVNDTRWYPVDAWEATHNRSVAGSRPASPTHRARPGHPARGASHGSAGPAPLAGLAGLALILAALIVVETTRYAQTRRSLRNP